MIGPLFLLFLFGLASGSFLNVLIWRLNDSKAPKFWQGRSICPKCRHELSGSDLVPIFSYLVLKGKCRYCHKKISAYYPLVEVITGILTVVLLGSLPYPLLDAFFIWLVSLTFVVIFFSDLRYGLIPDEMVVAGSVAASLFIILHFSFVVWERNLLVGAASAVGFLSVVLVTKFKGMGLGDVKLAFLIGLFLGWPAVLVSFWSAFVIGGVIAISLLLLKRTKLSATIPLGPFLVLGVVVSALWSDFFQRLLGL